MTDSPLRRHIPLGEQVTNHLRLRIIKGELAPGTRLVEEGLAAEYSVSRGPVRSALQRLALEDLIDNSPSKGALVIGLDEDDVEELYTLRGALEVLACERAVRFGSESGWLQMETSVEAMHSAVEAADYAAFSQADLAFHSGIYALANHARLMTAWQQYRPTFAALLEVTIAHDEHLSADDHAELLEVMKSGDVEAAAGMLREHLQSAQQRMKSALKLRSIAEAGPRPEYNGSHRPSKQLGRVS